MSEIAIDLVVCGHRVRGIDEARVHGLMNSIRDVGLLNPITVAPHTIEMNGQKRNGWSLVCGLHRFEAMKRLGFEAITATVVDLTGPAAMIAQCDENIRGSNLSPAERALFTRWRKAANQELHPETRPTSAGGEGRHKQTRRQLGEDIADRFTADATAKTGQPERTIQRDAQRGEKIPEEILQQIVGTPLGPRRCPRSARQR
jgi:ParB-like chromosome segregation protein Spo0J